MNPAETTNYPKMEHTKLRNPNQDNNEFGEMHFGENVDSEMGFPNLILVPNGHVGEPTAYSCCSKRGNTSRCN